jgi:hypothetical protein
MPQSNPTGTMPPPPTPASGMLDANLVKDRVKENVIQLRRDYEDLRTIDDTRYHKLGGPLKTMETLIQQLESSTM